MNEFSSVGQNGTVLFWLLDETATNICLNVHEAEVPDELLKIKHVVSGILLHCSVETEYSVHQF